MEIKWIANRFGEMLIDGDPSPAVEALMNAYCGEELSHVVKLDGQLGILIEVEMADEFREFSQAQRTAWLLTEVPEGVLLKLASAGDEARALGVFQDRACIWAFVPAEVATPELTAMLAKRALWVADFKREVWIVKGEVTCAEAHPTAKLGDVEWQFSDGPPGERGDSADYTDLEEGLRAFSGSIYHWVE